MTRLSDPLWSYDNRSAFSWRLDLPQDSNDRGMFLPRSGGKATRGQRRLMHYIAAGGMRQLRGRRATTSRVDHPDQMLRLFALFGFLWLLFRFLRCT